ncbi:MAG: FHA domain-containing protein [Deltaproteobacteria bacterium]|nr:FHA domain-containing protein [Deltaproteobacteria bacterium]
MLKLSIQDFEGRTTYVSLKDGEYSIGRDEANAICLSDRNVSRQHARLQSKGGHVWLENVHATYGTRLNNLLIRERTEVQPGDVVEVGDYKLELVGEEKRDTALRDESSGGMAVPAAPPQPASAGGTLKSKTPEGATAIVNLADISAMLNKEPAAPAQTIPDGQQPRMVVESENLRGLELRITKTPIIVGRVRESSDLVIDHRSISKEHARLTRLTDGTWQVLDLGSANGIKVNGEPYSKSELRSGDRLELGHVTLRFLAAGAKAPAAGSGGGSSGPSKGTWVMIGGLVAVLAIAAVVVVLVLGKGDKPGSADGSTDKPAAKGGSDKPAVDKAAAKAGEENAPENKAEEKGAPEAAKEEGKAQPGKEAAGDASALMETVEGKLAEGKYEQALPMLEAAKLQNPGSAPIAAKYAEVSRLVELKKDLDKAEKKLDTDPAMALELATDVRGKAPKGTPLYDGADSIVDMAKKKLSTKVAAPTKAAPPKEDHPAAKVDKPKEEKPKEVKVKEEKPKEAPAPEGKSSKDLYDDAREALGAGDYDRSIGSAKQALKSGYKKALTVLAKAYWGKGDKASCLSYAQKAIDAGFDDASMQNLVNKCQ